MTTRTTRTLPQAIFFRRFPYQSYSSILTISKNLPMWSLILLLPRPSVSIQAHVYSWVPLLSLFTTSDVISWLTSIIHPSDIPTLPWLSSTSSFLASTSLDLPTSNRYRVRTVQDWVWVDGTTSPCCVEDADGGRQSLMILTFLVHEQSDGFRNTVNKEVETLLPIPPSQSSLTLQSSPSPKPFLETTSSPSTSTDISFADIICHDIRNTLSGVSSNLDLLRRSINHRKQSLSTSIMRYLQQDAVNPSFLHPQPIDRNLYTQLPDDTSSIGAVKSSLEIMDCLMPRQEGKGGDIRDALTMVVDVFRGQAKMRGVKIRTSFPAMTMTVDERFLRSVKQVVINLLGNAINATERGGEVKVGAEAVNEVTFTDTRKQTYGLRVFVEDTGIGLADDELPFIFDISSQPLIDPPFMRSIKKERVGMGLAICKQLVTEMNGEIGVTSEKGSGSRFFFVVPWKDGREVDEIHEQSMYYIERRPPSYQAEPPPITDPRRLAKGCLIVDDNPIQRRLLSRFLNSNGIPTATAHDGR
ncbi:histidine kinase-like ATPase [Chytridium lagenaria]|nr:histidine kinase-like ATPase [Chytridium lagenaria]